MAVLNVECANEKLIPQYQSKEAAAFDLKASGNFTKEWDTNPAEIISDKYLLLPNERVLVKTGLRMEIPKDHWGLIAGRSGLAVKQGLCVLGGVIDADFRGEIGVILYNASKKPFEINKYDRVAQMVIQKYETVEIKQVEKVNETERGNRGLGVIKKQ
ncbi:MAG: dUTP diphosphatase [archaeon]